MPRVCFLLALAAVFVVSVVLGPSDGQSTLLWWHKALFVVTGGAMAMIALRRLPSDPSPQASSAAKREQRRE